MKTVKFSKDKIYCFKDNSNNFFKIGKIIDSYGNIKYGAVCLTDSHIFFRHPFRMELLKKVQDLTDCGFHVNEFDSLKEAVDWYYGELNA